MTARATQTGVVLFLIGLLWTTTSSAVAGPITDGLELWLDATDAATFTFDSGTLVSQWADKSGANHHATTGANFPTWQADLIGGQPGVSFNRQPLTIAGGLNVAAGQNRTAFVVMDYSVQTNNSEMLGTTTGNMIDVGSWDRPWRLRLRQTDNAFSAANSLPPGSHVIAVQANSSGTRAWSDGSRIINTADERFGWAMNSDLGIGGANFAGREYIGNLGEVLVYDRSLNPFEINEVGYYLQEKFNLAGSYVDPATLGTSSLPVTGGLQLWLDASDASTFSFDSDDKVAQWQDKSGQGNHATTAANFPTLQANAVGGMPAVNFQSPQAGAAAGTPLTISGGVNVSSGQDRTVFLVMGYSALLGNNEMFGTSTGQMVDVGTWTPSGNQSERLRFRDGSTNVFSAAGDVPLGANLLALQGSGSGTRAWRNGSRIVNSSASPFLWGMDSNLGVGGANFAGREFDGDLAEMIVFDRRLDPFEFNEVGYYLQQKYNLPGQFRDPATMGTSTLPVTGGLQLWLDAGDASTFTFDSADLVAQWRDKSGLDHHASTAANFPTLQPNVIGGMPAVNFQSTQGGASAGTPLNLPTGLDIGTGQDRTVLMVMSYDQYLGNNEILGPSTGQMIDVGTWTPSGNQNGRLRLRDGGANVFSPAGTVPAGANLLAIRGDASGVQGWRNGSQILDDATNPFAWDMNVAMQVGGANFAGREFHGDLAEMVIFDRALSEQELHDVGLYLQQKYNLFGTYDAPVADGLRLWLDAGDPRSLVLDSGDRVQGWLDRSGNGHDATPIGAAPTWTADTLNGRPAIDFDRTVKMPMSLAGDMGIADGQERTFFVVFDYDGLFNNNEILGTSTGRMFDVGTWTPSGQQDERLRLRYDSVNAFSNEGELGLGPHVLAVQARSDGTFAWADGEQLIDTAELAAHWPIGGDLKIGGTNYGGTDIREFDGRIAEILFYDRALSADEMQQVGAYLQQKYFGAAAVVPEPSSLVLFGLGALALAALARRRKR